MTKTETTGMGTALEVLRRERPARASGATPPPSARERGPDHHCERRDAARVQRAALGGWGCTVKAARELLFALACLGLTAMTLALGGCGVEEVISPVPYRRTLVRAEPGVVATAPKAPEAPTAPCASWPPSAPYWSEPVMVARGQGTTAPACPTDAPELFAASSSVDSGPPTCSACSCTLPLDRQGVPVFTPPDGIVIHDRSGKAIIPKWNIEEYRMPGSEAAPAWVPSTAVLAQPDILALDVVYPNTDAIWWWKRSSWIASGGEPITPPPTLDARACAMPRMDGIATYHCAIESPSGFDVCIAREGARACPATYPLRSVVYESNGKPGACSPCSCTDTELDEFALTLVSGPSAQNPPGSPGITFEVRFFEAGTGPITLLTGQFGNVYPVHKLNLGFLPPLPAVASGGQPIGDGPVDLEDPITLCCLPPWAVGGGDDGLP